MKKLILVSMLLVCTILTGGALAADGSEGHGVSAPPVAGQEGHG